MKKALLFIFITIKAHSQFLWQIYPDKVLKWTYYDGDEFNKNSINKSKWITALPWDDAVYSSDIYYTENNVKFQNGNVQFLIQKKDTSKKIQGYIDTNYFRKNKWKLVDGNKYHFAYSGGLLWSKKEYKYGYFEIKFKAPQGKGIWPAFWLYGAKPNNEIDFFELKGERENQLHVDIHCPDGCSNYKEGPFGYRRGWGHWIKTDQKLRENYNIVSGEWTPDYIKWYLNGELIAYSNHKYVIGMNLTAGTGIAKDGGPFAPGADAKTPFPNYFNVDYIRVYKTDTVPNYTEVRNNLSFETDTTFQMSGADFSAKIDQKSLKNNPDKKVKKSNVITLSVMQLSHANISVRGIGLRSGDKCGVRVKDDKNKLITELPLTTNIETVITIGNTKFITFQADVNNHRIEERIEIQ